MNFLFRTLCLLGWWHDGWRLEYHSGFAYTKDPRNNGRVAAAIWSCARCGHEKTHWYRWAAESAKKNGGTV